MCLLTTPASAETVQRVVDGDTVILEGGQRCRLSDIDAPERNQPGGKEATAALSELVRGADLELDGNKPDRYGRRLAHLFVMNHGHRVWVNGSLVANGHVWWYHRYSKKTSRAHALAKHQSDAMRHERGVWAAGVDKPVPPWEWRRKGRGKGRGK